ncbi:Spy/CpxP family protein refolding chaperone [Pseudoduganella lutea]|uniref:Spy/CpxP family protein refolding chaperone n=1 Tax=Pseudoduganella lutea TaxID=321985 RepID=UPI001E503653|nr:Spy/CpxP family protein refolding chaperone [Pseudoduganella lutea]
MQRLLLATALALPLAALAQGNGDEERNDGPRGGHADSARMDERRGPGPALQDDDGPRGPRGEGAGFGPGPGFDNVPPYLRGIDLSEAQRDKIFAIVHGQVPYLREQAKAREKADRALFALHGAAKFDDAAAVKLAQAAAQADANVTLSHLRTEQKVLGVLTAEQRKSLDERKTVRSPRQDGDREPGHPGAQ